MEIEQGEDKEEVGERRSGTGGGGSEDGGAVLVEVRVKMEER